MALILISLFSCFWLFFVAFSSAGITAYQAVPWNDFYMQGAPFSNQLHSRMPSSSTAGGQYFSEQTSYTQTPCLPSSPYFIQVPNGTTLGSMPHTGKQKEITTPGQSSYQSHQRETELTPLAEREEVESSSKKGESIVGNWKASWLFFLRSVAGIRKVFQDNGSSFECNYGIKTVAWMGMKLFFEDRLNYPIASSQTHLLEMVTKRGQ